MVNRETKKMQAEVEKENFIRKNELKEYHNRIIIDDRRFGFADSIESK